MFRFAPSPNGYLHLGHAYSALLNHSIAERTGGTLLLRMEDIDRTRCRDDYATAIGQDLHWLGIEWQPPVRRQSDHFGLYKAILDDLIARDLAFPCFCTRGTVLSVGARLALPRDPDGAPLYPGTCKQLSRADRDRQIETGRRPAYRLNMAAALAEIQWPLDWVEFGEDEARPKLAPAEPGLWGDALIGRRDVATSYHLSVVADDAAQGVTDVVRGRDLLLATGLHRVIQTLLGVPAPRYHHHRLILDEEGHKLSKSRSAPSLRDLRRAGLTAVDTRRRLGFP